MLIIKFNRRIYSLLFIFLLLSVFSFCQLVFSTETKEEFSAGHIKCYIAMEKIVNNFALYCAEKGKPAAGEDMQAISVKNNWNIICPASQQNKTVYKIYYNDSKLEVECPLHGKMSEMKSKYIAVQSKKVAAEVMAKAAADPLRVCYDKSGRLFVKIKKIDGDVHNKIAEVKQQIQNLTASIENDCTEILADGSRHKAPREELQQKLDDRNKKLDELKNSLKHDQKELDAKMSEAVKGGANMFDQPAVCPEKGVYSVTQGRDMKYILKCSVHGNYSDIYDKIYENEMKKSDPVKFCHGNISAIKGACAIYSLENVAQAEFSVEMLIKEGYLRACKCPAGGVYSIKITPDNKFECFCSIHK